MSKKWHRGNSFGAIKSEKEYEEERMRRDRNSKGFLTRTAFTIVISVCIGLFSIATLFYPNREPDPPLPPDNLQKSEEDLLPQKNDADFSYASITISKLGIYGKSIDDTMSNKYNVPRGLCVSYITGNASIAGMKSGDIITSVNGTDIFTIEDLYMLLIKTESKSIVTADIFREGEKLSLGLIVN
ncbi:MAG: PDZ domain-containing protein [Ruminococcaceae bacterium]|nr:PDZ domain-containing protein [Oscillospiraceae bacterium]